MQDGTRTNSPLRMEAVKSSTKKGNIATSKLLKSKKSWLTQTGYFQKAIDSSFDMIDVDKSGDVSLEEMYAGLLLIHLQLAVYAGFPACRVRTELYSGLHLHHHNICNCIHTNRISFKIHVAASEQGIRHGNISFTGHR